MCLIVLAVDVHPDFPLVVVANRDEFYARPSAPLHAWGEPMGVWAGKDMSHGGTWAAWSRDGRFAALTNIRRPDALQPGSRSRGELPLRYLQQGVSNEDFFQELAESRNSYAPFNLICGQWDALYHLSSDAMEPQPLQSGLHGLSNATLNTPWPKVTASRDSLQAYLGEVERPEPDALFDCLKAREVFPDSELPDTGVGLEWERTLSPQFIVSEAYGTRSTMVVMMDRTGSVTLSERNYVPRGGPETYSQRTFQFAIGSL